jgi:CRP-like cAMP-binding protein
MKLKVSDLKKEADALLHRGEAIAAMRIYEALLRRIPRDYLSRIGLADALAKAQHAQAASDVYRAVARLCIDGGLPLMAVVAIRAIEALGQPAHELIDIVAAVYHKDSDRVGDVGARLNVTYPDDLTIPAKELKKERTVAELCESAANLGCNLDEVGTLPPRFQRPPLLGNLSETRLAEVLRNCWVQRLPTGHVLMHRGAPGTSCFLVASGKLRVSAPDDVGTERELAQLGPGSLVGEMAVITGSPRLATVTVMAPSDLIELGPEALAAMGEELDQLAPVLDQLAQNRWMKNLLEQSPLFRNFDEDARQKVLGRCSAYQLPPGAVLFSQGEQVKGLYLLLRGIVEVEHRSGERVLYRTQMPAGSTIAVSENLNDKPADTTARAVGPTTVLFFSRKLVNRLLRGVPLFAKELHAIAQRREQALTSSHAAIERASLETAIEEARALAAIETDDTIPDPK